MAVTATRNDLLLVDLRTKVLSSTHVWGPLLVHYTTLLGKQDLVSLHLGGALAARHFLLFSFSHHGFLHYRRVFAHACNPSGCLLSACYPPQGLLVSFLTFSPPIHAPFVLGFVLALVALVGSDVALIRLAGTFFEASF